MRISGTNLHDDVRCGKPAVVGVAPAASTSGGGATLPDRRGAQWHFPLPESVNVAPGTGMNCQS